MRYVESKLWCFFGVGNRKNKSSYGEGEWDDLCDYLEDLMIDGDGVYLLSLLYFLFFN